MLPRSDSEPLKATECFWPLVADSARLADLVKNLLKLEAPNRSKTLLHSQFGLEAEVGIEQEQRFFSKPTTPLLPTRHQRRTPS